MNLKQKKENNDIVIDWGDNSTQFIVADEKIVEQSKDGTYDGLRYYDTSEDSIYRSIVIQHTYSQQKKYTVKIYGQDYYLVRGANQKENGVYLYQNGHSENLISRLMEIDLPVASNLLNVSSIATNSKRIQQWITGGYYNSKNVENLYYSFKGCTNLLQVNVSKSSNFNNKKYYSCDAIFVNCSNLSSSNFRIQTGSSNGLGSQYMYSSCTKLSADLLNLLPLVDIPENYNLLKTFTGVHLSCSDYAKAGKILWNSNREYEHTEIFRYCPSDFRDNIPVSYGGNIPDADILSNYSTQISAINISAEQLSTDLKTATENVSNIDTRVSVLEQASSKAQIFLTIPPPQNSLSNTSQMNFAIYSLTSAGSDKLSIYWGDSTITEFNETDLSIQHTYTFPGEYVISFSKNPTNFSFTLNAVNQRVGTSFITKIIWGSAILNRQITVGEFKECSVEYINMPFATEINGSGLNALPNLKAAYLPNISKIGANGIRGNSNLEFLILGGVSKLNGGDSTNYLEIGGNPKLKNVIFEKAVSEWNSLRIFQADNALMSITFKENTLAQIKELAAFAPSNHSKLGIPDTADIICSDQTVKYSSFAE